MKLKVEISNDAEDEIIIKCSSITDEVKLLQDMIGNVIENNAKLVLTSGDVEYFVPRNDILFFESESGRTAAHTSDKMLYTNYKLYELEKVLPQSFIRVSKSCILNCSRVSGINKNITGASEVQFSASRKIVYVSRMYYKSFREKMDEMRYSK